MPPKSVSAEVQRARKNERSRQRYQENKERIAAHSAERYRKKSEDPEFRRRMAEKSAKYRAENPHVVKAQNAKRRAADPELCRQQSRDWFAANPDKRATYEQNRRARKRLMPGKVSPSIRGNLYLLQKERCACCGERFSLRKLHLDHIMPLAKGGAHADENLQLLCQPCNQSKHAKHPVDFMQERGFLL